MTVLHMTHTARDIQVILLFLCRLLDGELDENTREAEMAVMQLLVATEPAQRKRAADGAWRPPQGSIPGATHAPWQAILRLHTLYSAPSPPSMSLIRHPQASFLTLWCIKIPASCAVVPITSHDSRCSSEVDLHVCANQARDITVGCDGSWALCLMLSAARLDFVICTAGHKALAGKPVWVWE